MQENIKNVVETIAEDVRKNWIYWVSDITAAYCSFNLAGNFYLKWSELCTGTGPILNKYYLAKETTPDNYTRIDDISNCDKLIDNCLIVKNWFPLTNSFVSVKDIKFYISNDYIPKVTINIIMQPSVKKWVKSNLIKENKIVFQTTISTRSY
jgi:hypothetical protein